MNKRTKSLIAFLILVIVLQASMIAVNAASKRVKLNRGDTVVIVCPGFLGVDSVKFENSVSKWHLTCP